MHVRCDNQYKTGAGGGYILGQPMLSECMGICVLSPAHEKLNERLPFLSADCKILFALILFKFSHRILDLRPYRGLKKIIIVIFLNIFREVCGPYL